MNKYYYDLHIHSCLSPCGDNDMTVCNIAGMAAIKGLNIVALTDHNTTANCSAFYGACKRNGIIPIAGVEITTAEEIHVVCLFEELNDAVGFESILEKHRLKIKNKVEIFGNQFLLDENDNILGEMEYLLPPATDLSLEQAVGLARNSGAFCFPAHIDRASNGMIGILGGFPSEPQFNCIEFSPNADKNTFCKSFPLINTMHILTDSDAHYLWDINEAENYMLLDDEPYSSDFVRKQFFKALKG